MVTSCYEDLTNDIARAAADGEMPDGSGPLHDVAKALGVPFGFRYDGRLRKAINVPYADCFPMMAPGAGRPPIRVLALCDEPRLTIGASAPIRSPQRENRSFPP